MSVIALIAWADDFLAQAVGSALDARGRSWLRLEPEHLAGIAVTLSSGGFRLDGREVTGVLWRVPPDSHFSGEFVEEDRAFADVETRAIWLSALHMPGLAAPFRPAAAAFFAGSGWPLWRPVLKRAGVRLAALAYGTAADDGCWLPYHVPVTRPRPAAAAVAILGAPIASAAASRQLLAVGGRLLMDASEAAPPPNNAAAAARALEAEGLGLAQLGLDAEGAVLTVDPFPRIDSPDLAARAARLLSERLDAAADRR